MLQTESNSSGYILTLHRHTERCVWHNLGSHDYTCITSGILTCRPKECSYQVCCIMLQAQRTSLKWNSKGTHFLGHTSCDFDSTNQSYFGESRLYLLTSDDRIDMQVTMEGEAMVSDCAWSPDGQFFVALGGISPSTAVLFDTKGKPVYQLGTGPYNQVCWNPQSRFILLAGFGNMPGDIRLFEKKADNACKPMGGCRYASFPFWPSPCHCIFCCAGSDNK